MKKLAIIGYGKMGRKTEELAPKFGFIVHAVIDNARDWVEKDSLLRQCDVAVEFTLPAIAPQNLISLSEMGLAAVCGTTGWEDKRSEVFNTVLKNRTALLVSSNFSIGMNLFFSLNASLAKVMNEHPEYQVSVSETHHIHKLDAPSGTAKTLADTLVQHLNAYQGWISSDAEPSAGFIPVTSLREGEVTGTHDIVYRSENDQIIIRHEAFNRNGLAEGALLAARWIIGRTGLFSMSDLLNGQNA